MRAFWISCCFLLFSSLNHKVAAPREILQKMLSSIKDAETLTFSIKKWERFKGIIHFSAGFFALKRKPRHIYMHATAGHRKGIKMVWQEGENDGNALVIYPHLPYIVMRIDPYGSLAREKEHHTVFEAGYDYLGAIISNGITRLGENYYTHLSYQGDTLFNNRLCDILSFDYPGFRIESYSPPGRETVRAIAGKYLLNDYMITELNPSTGLNEEIKAGQKIKIPNLYAKKVVIYVDKQLHLPAVQIVYDHLGIYEKYEFYNVAVNQPFSQSYINEFKK